MSLQNGLLLVEWEASMFTTYTGAPCSLCPKVKSCKRNSTSIQPQKIMRRPSINLKNSLLVEGRFWIKHHESPDKKTSGFISSGHIMKFHTNVGFPLFQLHFGVGPCEIAIIRPDICPACWVNSLSCTEEPPSISWEFSFLRNPRFKRNPVNSCHFCVESPKVQSFT